MILAILGCGPSGMIVRHAAERAKENGMVDTIVHYSRKEKSPIFGAQYLHKPVPDIPGVRWENAVTIDYRMEGKPEEYLWKVYGDTWDGTISDDLRDQKHLAWDLRQTYEHLWHEYYAAIVNAEVPTNPNFKRDMHHDLRSTHDLVINTIPRPALCWSEGHKFVSTDIWALGESDETPFPFPNAEGNVVQYNGTNDASWYRLSNIFDYRTAEWPGNKPKPPVQGVVRVQKPLRHNCDCMPGIEHLGRMGRWQNRYLAHEAYWDAYELIQIRHEEMTA